MKISSEMQRDYDEYIPMDRAESRIFQDGVRHELPAVFSSPSFVLFENQVPHLVQYCGMELPYRSGTPWVSHIHLLHLKLDFPIVVRGLVFALQSAISFSITQALQDLEADHCLHALWATVYE